MPLKKYRPTSPGRRFMSVSAFEDVTRGKKAEKQLLVSLKTDAGRNAQGKITVRHQGGGHRKLYRIIDFRRDKLAIPATVSAGKAGPRRAAIRRPRGASQRSAIRRGATRKRRT